MKSRRRHSTSSEDDSAESAESDSEESSGSEASNSGSSEPTKRRKKHKHREQSSGSDSDSRRRSKKRKHKKKKKKHGKKRHRSSDREDSDQSETLERKHKHKRKHSTSPASSFDLEPPSPKERSRSVHLQSVVQERRRSASHSRQPPRYYEYARDNERERSRSRSRSRRSELERFYRGSSKDRSLHAYRHGSEEGGGYEKSGHTERYRRDDHYQYKPRPPKYEEENDYREKPYRDRGYSGRPDSNRVLTCLVCGESHPGRSCRYPPRRDHRGPPPVRPERDERHRTSRDFSYEREERPHYRDRPERRERPDPRERQIEHRSHEPEERERGGEEKRERISPKFKERKRRFEDDDKTYSWGKTEVKKEPAPGEKDKPNFGLSGKLAADTNTVNGIVLKYSEPADAKQPKRRWRLYPFKGDKALPILYIHRQSCFILGREHRAVDIPLEHPSISKQHAALQYRATPFQRPDGTQGKRVRPYVIDLDSANGTFVNNKKIEPRRFVELLERDVIKFGFSLREYVLLHENSKDDDAADDGVEVGGGVVSIATVKRDKQVKQERAHDGE